MDLNSQSPLFKLALPSINHLQRLVLSSPTSIIKLIDIGFIILTEPSKNETKKNRATKPSYGRVSMVKESLDFFSPARSRAAQRPLSNPWLGEPLNIKSYLIWNSLWVELQSQYLKAVGQKIYSSYKLPFFAITVYLKLTSFDITQHYRSKYGLIHHFGLNVTH